MATAKHRAVDQIRRAATLRRKQQQLETDARIGRESEMADIDENAMTTSATTCSGSCSSAATPFCRPRRGWR